MSQSQFAREEDTSISSLDKALDESQTKAWMISPEAGALRRLWESSRVLAKRELEENIGTTSSLAPKKRISIVVLNDLVQKALSRGMSVPLARHAPSLTSVSKVLNSLGPNGDWAYVELGAYVSRQHEEVAYRSGVNVEKSALRIVYNATTGSLSGYKDEIPEISRDLDSLEVLRECLAVRAYSVEVAGVGTAQVLFKLSALYEESLTQLPPAGYRNPTIKEILKCDRLLLSETQMYLSQGQGSLDEAILHFVGIGRKDTAQFDLLKVVPEAMPCKGSDIQIKDLGQVCRHCQEPRSAHKGGRWCMPNRPNLKTVSSASDSAREATQDRSLPPAVTSPKKVAPGSSKRAATGKPALVRQSKRGRTGKANAHMADCLAASPSEKKNYCFDYHNSAKGCRNGKCNYSHRCPYNVGTVDSPQACDQEHPLYKHKA